MSKQYTNLITTGIEQYYDECGEMEGYRQKQVNVPRF